MKRGILNTWNIACRSRWIALGLGVLLMASYETADAQRSRKSGRDRSASTQNSKRAGQSKEAEQANAAGNLDEVSDLAVMTLSNRDTTMAAASKRPPAMPAPLTSTQLRAIVPLEKEIEVVIPLRGYPTTERPLASNRPIFAEARLGLHTTAELEAGYSGATWPFDYSARLELGRTSGHIDDAPRSIVSGALAGGYIIGGGYGIFSGGHMGAEVGLTNEEYTRYAVPGTPEREQNAWHVGATGGNTFAGITFDSKGSYRSLSLTDSSATSERSLEGRLTVSTGLLGFNVGATTDLRLTTSGGRSISYGSLDGFATYSAPIFTLRAGAMVALAGESDGNTVARFAPLAEIRFYPFTAVTLSAALTGGLAQNSLQRLLSTNPYVVLDPVIEHEVERVGYRATLRLEPARSFALRLTAAQSHYDAYAYFDAPTSGMFAPRYDEARVTKIDGDLYWSINRWNELAFATTFLDGSIGDTSRSIPYVPKWIADLSYTHRLSRVPIAITGTARYLGERSAPFGGDYDPAVIVGLEGAYAVTSSIDLIIELQNLLDTNYQLWEGYRERGFFGAIGARSRF